MGVMENQAEKKMENDTTAWILLGVFRGFVGVMQLRSLNSH